MRKDYVWSYTLLTSLRKTWIRRHKRHKGKRFSQLWYGLKHNMACINLSFPISVWMSPMFPKAQHTLQATRCCFQNLVKWSGNMLPGIERLSIPGNMLPSVLKPNIYYCDKLLSAVLPAKCCLVYVSKGSKFHDDLLVWMTTIKNNCYYYQSYLGSSYTWLVNLMSSCIQMIDQLWSHWALGNVLIVIKCLKPSCAPWQLMIFTFKSDSISVPQSSTL